MAFLHLILFLSLTFNVRGNTTNITEIGDGIEARLVWSGDSENLSEEDILLSFESENGESLTNKILSGKTYLLRVSLTHDLDIKPSFPLLSISAREAKRVTLYQKEGNEIKETPFDDTWSKHGKLYDPSVKIDLSSKKEKIYIIKLEVKKSEAQKVKLYFSTLGSQIEKEIKYIKYYYGLIGAFVFCLFMMLYFCFTFRKKYYIYGSISLLSKLASLLILWQVANKFYRKYPRYDFEKNIYYFVGLAGAIAGYEFIRSILRTKKNYRKFHLAIEAIKWLLILTVSLFALTNQKYYHLISVRNYLFFIMSNILMALLLYAKTQGEKSAFMLFIGRLPLWIFHVINFLEAVSGTSISPFPTKLESVMLKSLHLFFFSCALITRAKGLRTHRAIAKSADLFLNVLKESKNLNEVLAKIANNVKGLIPYDNVLIFLNKDGSLNNALSPPNKMEEGHINSIKDLVSRVQPSDYLVGEDIKSNPILSKHVDGDIYSSILILPLQLREESKLGYVIFLSSKYGVYEDYEINFAKDVAQKISILVEHYRQLSLINYQRGQISVDESLRAFTNTISHDVKSPMYAARSAIDSLKRGYETNASHETIKEYMKCVEEAIDDAMEEIEESISLINEQPEPFTLDFLFNSLDPIRKMCEFEKIKLEEYSYFSGDEKIIGPKRSIKNAVGSLLKSAVEVLSLLDFSEKKEIYLSYENENNNLCIKVRVSGKYIDLDEAHDAADGASSAAAKGLILARAILERNGFEFEVDSFNDNFTNIKATLNVLEKERV